MGKELTVGEVLDLMDEKSMVVIRTDGWQMENALSVGTINTVMPYTVADLIVREISPRNGALYLWAVRKNG